MDDKLKLVIRNFPVMRLLLVGFGAFCCLLHVAGFSGGVGCPLYISARIRTGGARSRSHVFDVNNGRRIAVFDAAAVPHRRCSMMSARHAVCTMV